MTVLEFCKKYDVPHQCVYDKIRRRPEVFEPYLMRDDKGNISDISPEIYDRLLPKDRIIEKLKSELAEVKYSANAENDNAVTAQSQNGTPEKIGELENDE